MTLTDLGFVLAILAPPIVASIAAANREAPRIVNILVAGALAGLVVGGVFTFFIWVASVHVPTGWNLLFGPLYGAALGLVPALLVWFAYALRVRIRRSAGRAV